MTLSHNSENRWVFLCVLHMYSYKGMKIFHFRTALRRRIKKLWHKSAIPLPFVYEFNFNEKKVLLMLLGILSNGTVYLKEVLPHL